MRERGHFLGRRSARASKESREPIGELEVFVRGPSFDERFHVVGGFHEIAIRIERESETPRIIDAVVLILRESFGRALGGGDEVFANDGDRRVGDDGRALRATGEREANDGGEKKNRGKARRGGQRDHRSLPSIAAADDRDDGPDQTKNAEQAGGERTGEVFNVDAEKAES